MKKFQIVLGTCVLLTSAAIAQLPGLPQIVNDPLNGVKLVQQITEMQQQFNQLVTTYNRITDQYKHMIYQAQQMGNLGRYRAILTAWKGSGASDTYGTTGGWISAINSGLGIPGGWQRATYPVATYGGAMANIPAAQASRVKTNYATLELADGSAQAGMDLVGRLRGNSAAVEGSIQALESDSLSADPLSNTQIAVLNKINAASVIALRNGADSNKLLVALTEDRVVEAKRVRDAEAYALASDVEYRTNGKRYMDAQAANASQEMMNFKFR